MSSLPVELTKLRRMLLSMGAEVEQRVNEALDSLLRHDLRLAEKVRRGDDVIDKMDVDVEAECVEILALHQPVARDLRYVLAALRINADLERIADLARGIAKRAIKLEHEKQIDRPPALVQMAGAVRSMVADALKALADQDEPLARSIRRRDLIVDDHYKQLMSWSVDTVAAQGEDAKAIIDTLSIVRAMERMADLTTNIAEATIFSIAGEVVRHTPV
ncbi:MAG TPA: phosphate transport system regulatory protein PhoU [Phycisphaerales bacterium]|nr:phosphate transport system regulatory protein PhoU [Phycisphaerales bacterium]